MAYFTLTPAAKADYRAIRAFLTEEAGPETAERFLSELEAAFERIAELRRSGGHARNSIPRHAPCRTAIT